ncbi:hypothetical protein B484DRAFT_455964, partial [Ochromonadaceae sp. CCMP2298]
ERYHPRGQGRIGRTLARGIYRCVYIPRHGVHIVLIHVFGEVGLESLAGAGATPLCLVQFGPPHEAAPLHVADRRHSHDNEEEGEAKGDGDGVEAARADDAGESAGWRVCGAGGGDGGRYGAVGACGHEGGFRPVAGTVEVCEISGHGGGV